uniref:Uncharacterized protein n=1 Tax=Acrobeloides nanus TaxID=290746 RepID=A0A914CBH9_9BILA
MFRHVNLATKDAVVLHLRRLNSTFNWQKTIQSNLLTNFVPTWNKAYQERLQKYNWKNYEWKNLGIQVNAEVEQCRNQVFKRRMKKCHNLLVCENKISAIKPNEWVRANNSWVVI